MSMSHRTDKQPVHTLKQTTCICFNYSWLSWQLAICSRLRAMQQADSSIVSAPCMAYTPPRLPGVCGWKIDKALPTQHTVPTYSENQAGCKTALLNLLSQSVLGAIVW